MTDQTEKKPKKLTAMQKKALTRGLHWRLRTPDIGGWRSRGRREVNNEDCFSSRTLNSLLAKGLMRIDNGGFVTSDAGHAALNSAEYNSAPPDRR